MNGELINSVTTLGGRNSGVKEVKQWVLCETLLQKTQQESKLNGAEN